MVRRVAWQVLIDASGVLTASIGTMIALVIVAVSTSEKSVNICQATRCNIPEDNHLHTRRHENLKSHQDSYYLRVEVAWPI
jgi:hypothetical protein